MTPYRNLGRDSNVVSYEVTADGIRVRFADGGEYLYTAQSAGAGNIARMVALAQAGRGLNGFINTNVRQNYASKSR